MAPLLLHRPCRWLRLTPDQRDVIKFGGLSVFKLGFFVFDPAHYIALRRVT